jgi:AraC-like DNA-binding protein
MRVEGETAILSYSINQQLALGSKQVCAGALAVIYNILTELCGNSWQPTDVCLVQEEPTSIRHYLKTFKLRPNFNAIQNSILFSSHWLTKNLPEMNPMINTLVQEKIKSLEQSCSDDLPNKVRRVLRDSLFNNSCTLEYMSNIFSLNSRTFNRRLADSGVHYQQLVDDIRFEISRQMLSDSEQTINDIALSLHFSDSRSFIRAFKRWSDTTPARWRKSNCINVSS